MPTLAAGSEVRRLFMSDGKRHISQSVTQSRLTRVRADELVLPPLSYLLLVALGQDVGVRAKC